jgi:hypothetical protein
MKKIKSSTNPKGLLFLALLTILLAFLLSACSGPAPASPDAVLPEDSPEIVVEQFYQWYSMYPGNALVDKAYQTSPYFSQEYIRELDKLVDKGGLRADPIVCAQDMANSFTAAGSEYNGTTALVRILSGFGNEIDVEVKPFDGEWKITHISCIH